MDILVSVFLLCALLYGCKSGSILQLKYSVLWVAGLDKPKVWFHCSFTLSFSITFSPALVTFAMRNPSDKGW